MNISQQDFTRAKRTVARLAKQVREETGEEFVMGTFSFVDPETGTIGFELDVRCALEAKVLRAVLALPNVVQDQTFLTISRQRILVTVRI